MIEWIITSSVMVCIVLLLRGLLRRRISPGVRYSLWLLVLIRLLLPVSVMESSVSVMNFFTQRERTVIDAPGALLPSQMLHEKDPLTDMNTSGADGMGNKQDTALNLPTNENDESENSDKNLTWTGRLSGMIWLTGTVTSAIFILAMNLQFRRRLRRNRKQLPCKYSRLKVYQSSLVTVPCLFGLFSPAVYVPAGMLRRASRFRYVVLHENTHFAHWDHVWALLRTVCLCVHWFNPLVWLAVRLSRTDAELYCDWGTVRQLNEEDRMKYGETVISLGISRIPFGEGLTCMTSLSVGKWQIKERIRMLARSPVSAVWAVGAVVLVCACAVCITFTRGKTLQTDSTATDVGSALGITSESAEEEDTGTEALAGSLEEEEKDPDAYLFGYNGYTGYLDECTAWTEYLSFSDCDYDNDGLTDRVFREEGEDGNECSYRIDFGDDESFTFPGKWVSGGFPAVSAEDLTGDGINEIIFTQSYGFSTDPMAFGELAVVTRRENTWQLADLPFSRVDDDYSMGLSLHYEQTADRTLQITCKEAALDVSVELDRNLWEDIGYNHMYPGQSFGHPVWDVTVEKAASGLPKLVCRMEAFDKWCGDEVIVEVVWSGEKFEWYHSEYIKSLYTEYSFSFDDSAEGVLQVIGWKKLSEGSCHIESIQVARINGESAHFIQTLHTEDVKLTEWGKGSAAPLPQEEIPGVESLLKDGGLIIEDLNFDGYPDIRLQGWLAGEDIPYYCWLWDEERGEFDYAFCMYNVEVDASHRRLVGRERLDAAGAGNSNYYFDENNILKREEL